MKNNIYYSSLSVVRFLLKKIENVLEQYEKPKNGNFRESSSTNTNKLGIKNDNINLLEGRVENTILKGSEPKRVYENSTTILNQVGVTNSKKEQILTCSECDQQFHDYKNFLEHRENAHPKNNYNISEESDHKPEMDVPNLKKYRNTGINYISDGNELFQREYAVRLGYSPTQVEDQLHREDEQPKELIKD